MNPVELHQRSLVVDLHCDALYQMVTRGYLITGPGPSGYTPQVSLENLQKGGVGAQTFAVWVPSNRMSDYQAYTDKALVAFHAITKEGAALQQARSADEVYLAREHNKIAALLSIEGAEAIGDKAEALRSWAKNGLVLLGLIWNRKNAFCDAGQAKEKPFGGLSPEGEKLVDLAAELGVLIDVSHASDDTFWDVMRRTTRPVIASHSSARSVFLHPRNLDDEQIRAIRATGGVIGVNFHGSFLTSARPVSIEDVADHVMHLLATGGAEVLALGSDFDGDIMVPKGLETAAKFPGLTEVLLKRGVPPEEVELFLGRNFLRALAKAKTPAFPAGSIPIPMQGVKASASSESAGFLASAVLDHNGRTSWKPKPDDLAPQLVLSGVGAVPSSVALRGASDLSIKVLFTAGEVSQEWSLTMPTEADGVTLTLPPSTVKGWKLTVTLTPKGAAGLAEVVAYE